MRTVQPNFYMPAVLIGTIDFHHFVPLSLTLTLPWGHKVSVKPNLNLLHTFHLIRMKFDVMRHYKLIILTLLLNKIYWNKENGCCFTDCVKNWRCHAFGRLQISLIQIWYDDRSILLYSTFLWYIDLDVDSGSQCLKARTSAPVFSQSFCTSFLTKFSSDINGFWSVETCWSVECCPHFILFIQ